MSRVRFATLRDLFSAFPTASVETGEEAGDEGAVAFLGRCRAEGRLEPALTAVAYLLPRRDAVWLACQAMRDLTDLKPSEVECVALARQWASRPEETLRRKALDRGLETSARLSGAWVALAAGWSGGSIAPAGAQPMPPSPAATAQAVRVALLSAAPRLAASRKQAVMTGWLEFALRALEQGMIYS